MKKVLVQIIISLLSIAVNCYGRLHNIPDAVYKSYGFPLIWGTHQVSSIAGVVNIWNVNITYLVIDLAFCFLCVIISQILIDQRMKA